MQRSTCPAKRNTVLPNVLDLVDVPLEPFRRPVLSSKMDWTCPFNTCHYHMNFLDPSGPFLNDLSANDRKYLQSKCWNSTDETFLDLFEDIAERHYFMHLEGMHVKIMGFATNQEAVNGEPILVGRKISGPGDFLENEEVSF